MHTHAHTHAHRRAMQLFLGTHTRMQCVVNRQRTLKMQTHKDVMGVVMHGHSRALSSTPSLPRPIIVGYVTTCDDNAVPC
jgi:hypothetical protein